MRFRNTSQREKYLFYACTVVILIFLFYNFIFKPRVRRWRQLNRMVLYRESKLKKAFEILPKKGRIEKEYNEFMHDFTKISSSREEIVASVLSRIETLARTNGIEISNMKPASLKEVGFYRICVIEMDSVSQIEGLTKFVYELEKPPSLLKVEKLELSLKDQRSNLLKIHMTISGILFFN